MAKKLSNQELEVDNVENLQSKTKAPILKTGLDKINRSDREEKLKISSLDIQTFCDHLEAFLTEAERFRKNVSGYPQALQERFNNDLQNLEFLFIETQETVRNIQKIKTQHKFVKKDLGNTEKILKKLKQEEIHEIEEQVSRFDANMYKTWETLKRSKNVDSIKKFSAELQEKCAALERLKELVNQKLRDTQETPLALVQFQSPVTKLRDKSVKNLTYESRKYTRPLRPKKRKHPDRNDVFVTIEDTPTQSPSNPPTVSPLPMGPIALTLTNSMGCSMSELTRITGSSQSLASTIISGNNQTETAIRDNMQTVFDALFNELKEENDGQYVDVPERPANFTTSTTGFDYINYDLNFL